MSGRPEDDPAYGEDFSTSRGYEQQQGDRGLIGDAFNKIKNKYSTYQQTQHGQQYGYGPQPSSNQTGGQWSSQPPSGQSGPQPPSSQTGGQWSSQPPSGQSGPHTQGQYGAQASAQTGSYGAPQQGYTPPYQQENPAYGSSSVQKPDLVTKMFGGLQGTIQNIGSDVAGLLGGQYQPQPYGQYDYSAPAQASHTNRYASFASEKAGNDVKWYVDGCGYMWAVSRALEGAKESIWILDWWLSPELYLRRPPSFNENYRLDRMLLSAAQRGVKVNIIVYKEVTQVLSLSSAHTKHTLEALHPNIAVFRHPDHLPDPTTIHSSLTSSFQNLKLDSTGVSNYSKEQLDTLFGRERDGNVLFWAHHEKLCLIDRKLAFMGGLDLCFGRWDTNQHPLSDVHSNIAETVFPGQDYNNARILDFNDVSQPFQNKLDRTQSSRMGWSDISCSLQGNIVQDLGKHFVDRWNFIFDEKYNVRKDVRYARLSLVPSTQSQQSYPSGQTQQVGPSGMTNQPAGLQTPIQAGNTQTMQFAPPPGSQPSQQPSWQSTSRPHTPTTSYGNPQAQSYQPQQSTSRPPSPLPPTYQQPPASYSPQPASTYYPPPPPGGPPQSSYQQPAPYGADHTSSSGGFASQQYNQAPNMPELDSSTSGYQNPQFQGTRGFGGPESYEGGFEGERGFGGGRVDKYKTEGKRLGSELQNIGNMVQGHLGARMQNVQGTLFGGTDRYGRPLAQLRPGNMSCQIVRSCCKWSNGVPTEHSHSAFFDCLNTADEKIRIQDAYIDVIQKSQYFVYIENQFFITKTDDSTSMSNPVKNQIGRALVERVLRAARSGEKYKVIVVIPSVPGFAGDLRDSGSLGTRAIMELQYNSIARGGSSIFEVIAKAGYNPQDYIRFYNLRNYDRINMDRNVQQVERQSGVQYEDARKQHDDIVGAGFAGYGEGTRASATVAGQQYQQYQQAAPKVGTTGGRQWDTVSECYMLDGTDIRSVPWEGVPEAEIDAFVSEELYIHSKVLIADDRVVICGSANLNDRSQVGNHDSEIAVIIDDPTPVQTTMAGKPWQVSRFAASLRRQLFRKHLGLVRPQDMTRPDANFEPVGVPNAYDWDTPEDQIVSDPLSDTFQALWNSRARTNTDVFRKVFRCVPDDNVQSWDEYKEFFEYFFQGADIMAEGKLVGKTPPRYRWGHIVRDDFPRGPEGIRQVKDLLSQVKGTLVEMPLMFLANEDIAKEGLKLNPLTVEVYT